MHNATPKQPQLYEATDRPDQAAELKKKLAGSDKAER